MGTTDLTSLNSLSHLRTLHITSSHKKAEAQTHYSLGYTKYRVSHISNKHGCSQGAWKHTTHLGTQEAPPICYQNLHRQLNPTGSVRIKSIPCFVGLCTPLRAACGRVTQGSYEQTELCKLKNI